MCKIEEKLSAYQKKNWTKLNNAYIALMTPVECTQIELKKVADLNNNDIQILVKAKLISFEHTSNINKKRIYTYKWNTIKPNIHMLEKFMEDKSKLIDGYNKKSPSIETDILMMATEGQAPNEIAEKLNIRESTVLRHLSTNNFHYMTNNHTLVPPSHLTENKISTPSVIEIKEDDNCLYITVNKTYKEKALELITIVLTQH